MRRRPNSQRVKLAYLGSIREKRTSAAPAQARFWNRARPVIDALELRPEMHAHVLDSNGKTGPLVMGSYGIGLERILSAAVEQNHDADGMFLPRAIAPFDVILTAANMDDTALRSAAEKLYEEMQAQSLDVLFDDRSERPGVKFKDADLIGVPIRVTLGKRKFEQGLVEIFERSTKRIEDVKLENSGRTLKDKYLR